jgi:hypothetical protein
MCTDSLRCNFLTRVAWGLACMKIVKCYKLLMRWTLQYCSPKVACFDLEAERGAQVYTAGPRGIGRAIDNAE